MDNQKHVLESLNLEELMSSNRDEESIPRSYRNDDAEDFIMQREITEPEIKDKEPEEPETNLEEEETLRVKEELEDNEEDEGKSPESNSSKQDSSIVFPLAKVFQERGHLPSDLKQEDINSIEDLLDMVETNVINNAESKIIESLPDVVKEIIVNYKEGVPLDFLINNKSRQIEVSNITEEQLLEDEDLQKNIVTMEMEFKGMDSEAIKEHLELLEKAGNLDEKAIKAKKFVEVALKKQEEVVKKQVEQQKIQMEEQIKQNQKKLRELIDKQKEVIPGVTMTKRLADEIYRNIITPVTYENKTPISNIELLRRKDPLKFEMNLQILYKLGALEGNWEKVFKYKDSKAATELLKSLENGNTLKSDVRTNAISTDTVDPFDSLKQAITQQKHKLK